MGFREDFAWGTATSSYQIEGAVKGEGKGEHIWDVYTKEPGHVFEDLISPLTVSKFSAHCCSI